MAKLFSRTVGLLILVLLLGIANMAAAADGGEFDTQVKTWDRSIDTIDRRVESGRTGSLEERELREQLKTITDAAMEALGNANKLAAESKSLLDALGPPPADGANAEAAAIKSRRTELNQQVALFEGQAKQTGLIIAKAEQLQSKINLRSRERLKDTLFDHTVSPLSQKAWAVAVPEAYKLFDASFIDAPAQWWISFRGETDDQLSLWRNVLIALVAAVASWAFGRWLRQRFGRVEGIEAPNHSRRLLAGVVEGGGRSLAPIVFVALTSALLFDADLIKDPLAAVVQGVTHGLMLFFFGYALINANFTPRHQQWRLFNFSDDASRRLIVRLQLILVTFLVFDGFHNTTAWATPSAELGSVSTLVFTLVLTPLLISLLDTRIWAKAPKLDASEAEADPLKISVANYSRARTFLTLGLLVLPLSAALGYSGLATYAMRAMIMSGLMLAGLALLRSVGREGLAAALDAKRPLGRHLHELLALDHDASRQVLFWLRALFDLGLLGLAGIALLPVWGLGAGETAASLTQLLRGIKIGSYTFSLLDIFIGIFVFAAVIFVTRLVQKGLENHVLPNLTADKGIRDALGTGVGYIGVVAAGLVTISVLGLDLTNLAIVAGALSVGIGFGLQNVVNNFVSGLILLAERPIKPGDWVVIGGHEGKVKKVNVRSTEIETFRRASVIIPNADLIASPVINWTHKNIMGRVEILVGVAYGTDPRLVESVLLTCARQHKNVMSYPEPSVLFKDFADSSLNFELRAFLSDVEERLTTGSDLRYAIHDAFAEKGIQIPFPQRVVHMVPPPAPDGK